MVMFLAMASFSASIFLYKKNPQLAYFSTFTRIWEIMVGCILALNFGQKWQLKVQSNQYMSFWISVLGMICIFAPVVIFNDKITYPKWNVLLPVIGSFLCLSAPSSWLNRTILTFQPLVGLGLISYPLYLVHWPILSFV